MRRQATKAGALALALALALAALAAAAVIQQGNIRMTVLAQVMPYRLPRTTTAPIAVFLAGHLAAVDGSLPPQLQSLDIQVNRHALLQSHGLSNCPLPRIEATSTPRALAACGPSLVGSGQFWANVVLPGQAPYPTQGRILVFNGRTTCSASRSARPSRMQEPRHARTRERAPASLSGGHAALIQEPARPATLPSSPRTAHCHPRPVLLAHIFTRHPFATSFVIAFSIHRISKGPYGTELSASLPQALGSWGYLDRIKMTLRRKYQDAGRRLSYFNASCPASPGFGSTTYPLALVHFHFAGEEIATRVDKVCGVRR
jgi:hypothetical protein